MDLDEDDSQARWRAEVDRWDAVLAKRERRDRLIGRLLIPVVLVALLSGFAIAIMVIHRVWDGAWTYMTLGEGLARVGVHYNARIASWPLNVIILVAAVSICVMANDIGSDTPYRPPASAPETPQATATGSAIAPAPKERKPMRLPRFLWPQSPRSETTVLIRLGRVVHWFTITLAAMALALGIFIGIDSVRNADASSEAARQWDATHPAGAASEYAYSRPYVSDADLGGPLLVGLVGAFVLAVTGRGIRYILAGE